MKPLTLQDLNIVTQHYLESGMDPNTPILITTADKSIGSRAYVTATDLYNGFDWEHGQLRISTNEKILKYNNDRDTELEPIIRYYNINDRKSTVISCQKCDNKLRKDDCYCSRCGQKIKKVR